MAMQQLLDTTNRKTWLNARINILTVTSIRNDSGLSFEEHLTVPTTIIFNAGGTTQSINIEFRREGNIVQMYIPYISYTLTATAVTFQFSAVIPPSMIPPSSFYNAITANYADTTLNTDVPYKFIINNNSLSGTVLDHATLTFPANTISIGGISASWPNDTFF